MKAQPPSQQKSRPRKYQAWMCDKLLEMMKEGASLTGVALAIGINRMNGVKKVAGILIMSFPAQCLGINALQAWWERSVKAVSIYIIGGSIIMHTRMRFPKGWSEKNYIKQDVQQTFRLSDIDVELLADSEKNY